MAIRIKSHVMIAGLILLSFSCRKKNESCPKAGYEFINTTSKCWYEIDLDSIPLGGVIILRAAVPKKFLDENSNSLVTNTCSIIKGSFGMVMLSPVYQPAADSIELSAEVGQVIKDSLNFSPGILKGFRTIIWDGTAPDSFRMKIKIKPLTRGIYDVSLKQQGYRDAECAVFKYFTKVASDQHLHYWSEFNNGVIDDFARNYAYCFKVY